MPKNCVNKCVPDFVDSNLKWYVCDDLLTYIDELKYKEFIRDTDAHFKNEKVVNFNIIHYECRDDPLCNSVKNYRTLRSKDFKGYSQKEKKWQYFQLFEQKERFTF